MILYRNLLKKVPGVDYFAITTLSKTSGWFKEQILHLSFVFLFFFLNKMMHYTLSFLCVLFEIWVK